MKGKGVFMQVNSISSSSVAGKTSFGNQREMLENFANADDKTLRKIAMQKTAASIDDKKHRRITNAIYYSIPVAAGLAAVVRNPAKAAAKGISRARMINLGNFAGTALNWAGTFAIIDLVFGGARKLNKSSETVREFNKEHPVLSMVATVGAGIGTLFLAGKGLSKLAAKIAKKPMTLVEKKSVAKLNMALNDSKALNWISKNLKKVPSSIKSFAKTAIDWSPMLLVFTSIAHSFNHSKVKTAETVKNYTQLKDAQMQVREALANAEEAEV